MCDSSDAKNGAEVNSEIVSVDDASVVVQNVSKRYVINQSRSDDARTVRTARGSIVVDALRDTSFVVTPGESVGLVGINGSGKSTLLSMLAGGQSPTTGRILTKSKPTLMGVSPALQADLSGERNIYLGCLALGMTPEAAKEQIDLITEWTELGDAIKRPMRTYSSGMSARLAFAISTAIDPEILLIDEALSTGDAAFSARAEDRMKELLNQAGNLFLVSHALGQIESNCKRTLWLNKGSVVADGPTETVIPRYRSWAHLVAKGEEEAARDALDKVREAYRAPRIVFQ